MAVAVQYNTHELAFWVQFSVMTLLCFLQKDGWRGIELDVENGISISLLHYNFACLDTYTSLIHGTCRITAPRWRVPFYPPLHLPLPSII
jgi:hypothetical protein